MQASDLEAPLGDCLSWCERFTECAPRILSEDYVFDLVVGRIDGGWGTLLTESGTTVTALRSPELAPTALGFLPEYFRERYAPPYQPSAVARPESGEAFSAFLEARCLGAARRAESTQADADSESEIHRSRALLLTD
jgi:hypothetical protein